MKLKNCPFCDAEVYIDTSVMQFEEDPYLEVDHKSWCPLLGKGILDGEELIDPFFIDEFIRDWNTRGGRAEIKVCEPDAVPGEGELKLLPGEVIVPMDLMRSFLKIAGLLRTMTNTELDEILSEYSNKTRTKRFLKQIPTFIKKALNKIQKGD